MHFSARRQGSSAAAVEAIRAIRRRELFRVAAGDLLGMNDVLSVGTALSDLASATIDAALDVIRAEAEGPVPRIAVIAMGRWGGRELSYASDADAMFVMEDASTGGRGPDQGGRRGDQPDADPAGQARCRPVARASTPTCAPRARAAP